MIHEISNSEGKPVIFLPLTIILCVTAIKDAYEDMKRHLYDKKENNKPIKVARNKTFVTEEWRDLRIGNLVRVERDEPIPADMILVYSSNFGGSCYVETKNLDGETNLKVKQIPKKLQSKFTTIEKIFSTFSVVKYEKPNPFLYKFQGVVEYESDMKIHQLPINMDNFLLRGCSLKQTDFIVGIVAYTGNDTKIMLNSVKARPKLSSLQVQMNSEIVLVFFVQVLFCLLCAYLEMTWQTENFNEVKNYLGLSEEDLIINDSIDGFLIYYGMWMMLFTNFVPISLLVTLDMVKFFQSMKITGDKNMISKDGIEPLVQSSGLNEELGQVGFIFTDKTVFKAFSLQDKVYGLEKSQLQDQFQDDKYDSEINTQPSFHFPSSNSLNKEQDFYREFNSLSPADKIEEFLVFLATCHEIIVETYKDSLVYNACSPDDLCLVEFAKQKGYELIGMDFGNILTIQKNINNSEPVKLKYKILNILPFSSARKRMSVIYQKIKIDKDGQETILEDMHILTKGADSLIMSKLDNQKQDQFILQKTHDFLIEFAKLGYRTLVLAKGKVDPVFYKDWSKRLHEASILLSDDRDEKVETINNEIEQNLFLFGCTAIEDKLQENVPYTISKLREAGIQIWMLTGDKRETAINVGILSSIIEANYKRIVIDFEVHKYEEIHQILKQSKKEILAVEEGRKTALIISGVALDQMSHQSTKQQSDELLTFLLKLAQFVDSVIVCRVSPKQKRQIVDLFRQKNPEATTLAIGDGANDVNMIIGAHVGIGIRGLEGQQAARASDFAISEFQMLGRLLLYYGREFYRKNSNLVLYNFYKNILLVLPQFWYGFYNGFSGQFLYDLWIFQMYNIIFTSAPIVVFALFDKEFKGKFLTNTPCPYYLLGLLNQNFNKQTFWQWFFIALIQSCFVGLVCGYILNTPLDNLDTYMLLVGNFMYSNVILITNLKILLITKSITPILILFICGSIVSYFVLFYIIDTIISLDAYHIFQRLYSQPEVWLGHVFVVVGCLVIDYVISNFKIITRFSVDESRQIIEVIRIPYQKIRLSISVETPRNIEMSEYKLSHRSQQQLSSRNSLQNIPAASPFSQKVAQYSQSHGNFKKNY